jgi:hypothetical protein
MRSAKCGGRRVERLPQTDIALSDAVPIVLEWGALGCME